MQHRVDMTREGVFASILGGRSLGWHGPQLARPASSCPSAITPRLARRVVAPGMFALLSLGSLGTADARSRINYDLISGGPTYTRVAGKGAGGNTFGDGWGFTIDGPSRYYLDGYGINVGSFIRFWATNHVGSSEASARFTTVSFVCPWFRPLDFERFAFLLGVDPLRISFMWFKGTEKWDVRAANLPRNQRGHASRGGLLGRRTHRLRHTLVRRNTADPGFLPS